MQVARITTTLILAVLVPSTAGSEIVFRSRTDVAVGSAPIDFALLAGSDSTVLVANDDGIAILRRHGQEYVVSGKLPGVQYVKSVAAGTLRAGASPSVAYTTRDARRVSFFRLDSQGKFEGPVHVTLPALPRVVRISAIDSGRAAAFVAHDDGLAVVFTDRHGRFHTKELAALPFAADLYLADLNHDKTSDLVVADEYNDSLAVFEATAETSFHPARMVRSVRAPRRVRIGDANEDGQPDIFVLGSREIAVHVQRSDAEFGDPISLWSSPHLSDLAVGDSDGDGHLDVAVTDRSRGTMTFLMGTGDGAFVEGDSYSIGSGPEAVLLADITGDRMVDALVLNHLSHSATILRNLGTGKFNGSRCILTNVDDLSAIAVADFNRDSRLDLAVTSEKSGTLSIFLGDGRGHFTARTPIRIGSQPRGIVAGDLDGDGRADLATVDFGTDEVALLSGDGRGGFAAPILIPVGLGPTAIVAGRFSRTNRLDLAVANLLSESVSILYGDGRGRFPSITTFQMGAQPTFLLVGDVDRDRHADLVVGSDFGESVSILSGNGRELTAPQMTTLSGRAHPSVAEDLDGDGHIDLVVVDEFAETIDILPGTGPGEFGSPLVLPIGRHAHTVAAGDFDGDRRPDLAIVHRETRIITLLINGPPM